MERRSIELRAAAKAALSAMGLKKPAITLWLMARQPERLKHEVALWADYLRFRHDCRFLREPVAEATAGRTLVINLTDLVAQAKAESMLAKALELHGYEPIVVTASRLRHVPRYYGLFGFKRLIYFDRYMPAEIPPAAVRTIDAIVGNRPTFDTVKNFRYGSVDVGRLTLATVLRSLHLGRLDFDAAETRRVIRQTLSDGVAAVVAAERLLDETQPDIALVNDAQYVGVGAIFESALSRGVRVIQWLGSTRDDAMTFRRFDWDTRRQHPISLSDESWALVSQWPWTDERERELQQDFTERYVDTRWHSYYNRAWGSLKGREEAALEMGLDPKKKTATIFAHILWDSTLFWGEDLFDNYEDWLVEAVRAACANTAVNWIVKLHPANAWKLKRDGVAGESLDRRVLREQVGQLPPHVRILDPDADFSAFTVLRLTDYCLTVRGTVGVEAAALGASVLTAGTGRYSGLGFTVDSGDRREYLERLRRIETMPPPSPAQIELAKKYAHALFVLRPARMQTFQVVTRSLAELGHPLDHNVEIAARSLDDLRRAVDLTAFARWATGSRALDFINTVPNLEEAAR